MAEELSVGHMCRDSVGGAWDVSSGQIRHLLGVSSMRDEPLLIPILQSKKPRPERMRGTPPLDYDLAVAITDWESLGAGHFLFCNVALRAPQCGREDASHLSHMCSLFLSLRLHSDRKKPHVYSWMDFYL